MHMIKVKVQGRCESADTSSTHTLKIIWKIIQHCSTHTKMPQQTLIKYCSNQQSCVQIRHCLVLPIDMIFSGIFFSCKTFVIDHYHSRGEKRRTSFFYANRWLPLFFSHTPRTLSTSINHHVFFLCARFLLLSHFVIRYLQRKPRAR